MPNSSILERLLVGFSCNHTGNLLISALQVHVVREKITWPGARIKKKEEGMPNYENNNIKGDLYITFDIEFPRGGLEDNDKEGWYESSIS